LCCFSSLGIRKRYRKLLKRKQTGNSRVLNGNEKRSAYKNSSGNTLLSVARRDDTGGSRQGKTEVTSSEYSPIKTRGFVKKKYVSCGLPTCNYRLSFEKPKEICILTEDDVLLSHLCFFAVHLTCLGYPAESASMIFRKRSVDWQCPMCVLCTKCSGYVYDAENVQCFFCDRSYHGRCRPDDCSGVCSSPTGPWYCPDCKVEPRLVFNFLSNFLSQESLRRDVAVELSTSSNQLVHFGVESEFEALHRSPYPKLLSDAHHLYVCQFCLTAVENSVCCEWRHPPGNEIYREGLFSFWEVDGEMEKSYCQRLCLLAKLFLSSKTLHREVEMFIFYLLTKCSADGCVLIGYFSKEKVPSKNNNLSCLLTLPSSLRRGYGRYLIDLSYKLSLREKKVGGPEHPLSDLGLVTYRGYWRAVLFSYLRKKKPTSDFSLKGKEQHNIAKRAYMAPLKTLRRRVVKDELLFWEPEFEVDSDKIGNYASNKPLF
uniref:Histone acetyltransferase n=1 Tax=Enterobius vermicularis TaxID=51028 RepID=A0A0N4UZB0_ENTVE